MPQEPRVAILAPVRGETRIKPFMRMADSALLEGACNNMLFTYFDIDDPALGRLTTELPYDGLVVGPRVRLAKSWTALVNAAEHEGFEYLFFGADDITFSQGWDSNLIESLNSTGGIGWSYGFDGIWDHTLSKRSHGHLELPCHWLTTVETFRACGGFPEGMQHFYLDNVMRDIGLATDTLTLNRDVRIEHHHWSRRDNDVVRDQTYNDSLAETRGDQAMYAHWRKYLIGDAINAVLALRDKRDKVTALERASAPRPRAALTLGTSHSSQIS